MFPRHHALLSATMLALAATMSEEDSPVVPSPEPDEGAADYDATLGREGPESHWSSVLGRAILDDMRTDEAAQEGSHYDFNEGQGHGYDGRYEPTEPVLTGYAKLDAALSGVPAGSLGFMIGGPLARRPQHVQGVHRARSRPAGALLAGFGPARAEQRAAKKARAKRKAKKGWA